MTLDNLNVVNTLSLCVGTQDSYSTRLSFKICFFILLMNRNRLWSIRLFLFISEMHRMCNKSQSSCHICDLRLLPFICVENIQYPVKLIVLHYNVKYLDSEKYSTVLKNI